MREKAGGLRQKEMDGKRMDGKMAGRIRGMIFLGLAVFFMGRGILGIRKAAPLTENISLVCGEAGISAEELDKIRGQEQEKEDGMEFTAWTWKRQALITDAEGYRSAYVEAVELNGSSELLLPYGKILHKDDLQGCFLGEAAAWKLFGSRNVEGLTLRYGDRELTVRYVLQTPENLIVLETEDESERFGRITLKTQEGVLKKRSVENFVSSYGLDVTQICFDLFSGERLLELIPGKWSDSSGWEDNIKALGQDAVFLISVEKSSLEAVWLSMGAKALMWLGAGTVCLYLCWKSIVH